ncbi:MAG TPA: lytic transglycosylase domain-containing protein [Bryobacteraceae bacterium]|nr:lytic transglycosylase domain-containing protein [Bryobacteraceae bacterium]
MKLLFTFLVLAIVARAGEYALLTTGARLRVDRHETQGAKIRLHLGGGTIEMDASQVAAFEPEEAVPQPLAAPAAPSQAAAPDPKVLVAEAARKYGLPEAFLHSVVKAESGYRQDAVSPKGAIGLMQLMPATARMYGADPTDATQNMDAGARYLAELLIKYEGGVYRALAAYNAGPGAVDKYNGNIPPYRETQEYVRRIVENYNKAKTGR